MPDTQKRTAALLAELLAGRSITSVENCLDEHSAGRFDIYYCEGGALLIDYFESENPGVEIYASIAAYENGAQPDQSFYADEFEYSKNPGGPIPDIER